ncbi:kinesin-like protein [Pseudoscourfieldia marina]
MESSSSSSSQQQQQQQGDNIRVHIRVRPPSEREVSSLITQYKKSITTTETSISISSSQHQQQSQAARTAFNFDSVRDEHVDQASIFESIGRPITDSFLEGYHACVLAYGQTGAGKTYTMQGADVDSYDDAHSSADTGLIPRVLKYVFGSVSENNAKQIKSSNFRCTFFEIYNEQVYDLLADDGALPLVVREGSKASVFAEGAVEECVGSAAETYEVYRRGLCNRRVSSTAMNRESSRSHSVFVLYADVVRVDEATGVEKRTSSALRLVDLAGSERQSATQTDGQRLKEASSINRSLSALGNVIKALVDRSEGKERHVPYRDSKLTFLLRDCLGGQAKCSMIANISPAAASADETLSTLKFAQRAKLVKNSAAINEVASGSSPAELHDEIKRLRAQLENAHKNSANGDGKAGGALDSHPIQVIPHAESRLEALQHLYASLQAAHSRAESDAISALSDCESRLNSQREVSGRLDKTVQSQKMVLRLRENTIKSLQSAADGNTSQSDAALDRATSEAAEIELLRRQVECHPDVVRHQIRVAELEETLNKANTDKGGKYATLAEQHDALKNESIGLRTAFADAVSDRQSIASTLRDVTTERDALAEAKAKSDAMAAHATQAAAEAHTQVYEMKVQVEEANVACEVAKEKQTIAENERNELSVLLAKETESKAKLQIAFEEQSKISEDMFEQLSIVTEKHDTLNAAHTVLSLEAQELRTEGDSLRACLSSEMTTFAISRLVTAEREARVADEHAIAMSELQASKEEALATAQDEKVSALEQAEADKVSALEQAETEKVSALEQAAADKASALDEAAAGKASALEQAEADKVSALEQAETEKVSALEQAAADKASALDEAAAGKASALEQAEADKVSALEQAETEKVSALEQAAADKASALDEAAANKASALEQAEADKVSALEQAETEKVSALEQAEADKASALDEAAAGKASALEQAEADKAASLELAAKDMMSALEQAEIEKTEALKHAEADKASALEQAAAEKDQELADAISTKDAEMGRALEDAAADKEAALNEASVNLERAIEDLTAAKDADKAEAVATAEAAKDAEIAAIEEKKDAEIKAAVMAEVEKTSQAQEQANAAQAALEAARADAAAEKEVYEQQKRESEDAARASLDEQREILTKAHKEEMKETTAEHKAAMKEAAAEHKAAIKEAAAEHKAAIKEKEQQMASALEEKESAVAALRDEVDEARREALEHSAALAEAQTATNQATKNLKEANKALKQLETAKAKEVEEAEAALKSAKEAEKKASSESESVRAELAGVQDELASQRVQLTKAQDAETAAMEEMEALREQLAQAQQQQEEATSLASAVSAAKEEMEALREQLSGAKEALASTESSAKEEMEALRVQLTKSKEALMAADAAHEEEKRSMLRNSARAAADEKARFEKELAASKTSSSSEDNSLLATLKQQLAESRKEADDLRSVRDALRGSLKAATSRRMSESHEPMSPAFGHTTKAPSSAMPKTPLTSRKGSSPPSSARKTPIATKTPARTPIATKTPRPMSAFAKTPLSRPPTSSAAPSSVFKQPAVRVGDTSKRPAAEVESARRALVSITNAEDDSNSNKAPTATNAKKSAPVVAASPRIKTRAQRAAAASTKPPESPSVKDRIAAWQKKHVTSSETADVSDETPPPKALGRPVRVNGRLTRASMMGSAK